MLQIRMLNEKLDEAIKLKDQMNTEVQALKQNNSVLKAQLETQSTGESQKETIGSLKAIIKNFESKTIEKEELIKD